MKKVSTISMALAFTGTLLGAGYVSGQELWQYFGSFGRLGLLGLILSLFGIAVICVLILWISGETGKVTLDEIVIRFDIPWLKVIFTILCFILYFVVSVVMIAGMGALGEQLLGMPRSICALIATALVIGCVFFGLSGMITVFDFAVPILVVCTIVISIVKIANAGTQAVNFSGGTTNPLLGNWAFSAFNYTNLNYFAGVGILAPLVPHFKKKNVGSTGIALGAIFLTFIAIAILSALCTSIISTEYPLPMLDLAQSMGPFFVIIYGILLFVAMFGNANATLVATMTYLENKFTQILPIRKFIIIVLGIIAYFMSLTGFTELVGIIYPAVGYFGMACLVFVIEHAIHLKREKGKNNVTEKTV